MINERQTGSLALHIIAQASFILLSFFAWYVVFVYFLERDMVGGLSGYLIYADVMVVSLFVLAFFDLRSEQFVLLSSTAKRLKMSFRQTFVIFSVTVFFLVAIKDTTISRSFFFSYIPVLWLTLTATNFLLPTLMLKRVFHGTSEERCLLISWDDLKPESGNESEEHLAKYSTLSSWLLHQSDYGMKPVGILSPHDTLSRKTGIPFLGDPKDFADALLTTKATSLIFLQLPCDKNLLKEAFTICDSMAVRLSVLYDLEEEFGHPVRIMQVNGRHVLHFRSEPLQNPLRRIGKRTFDFFFSLSVSLILLPPLTLIVWIMQCLQSPGSVFYTQRRNGQGNTTFEIIKFRSMHVDGNDIARQATKGDPRIFPFGRFLRATSLDEMPQFLNVLKGEMSIVGPRPHLPEHNQSWMKILRPYHVRSFVKPGITGLAQIRGLRGEATSEDEIRRRVEFDIEYIEKWSFRRDLMLIARTVAEVFFPNKKAY
jgi:exopolysaccharide biosynthesis polyprenyl glycosylphosphotransferase